MIVFLKERINYLKQLIEEKKLALIDAPKEGIRVCKHGEHYQYYKRSGPEDKNGCYMRKEQREEVRKLVQKEYDESVCKVAEQELKVLQNCLKRYPKVKVEQLYDHLTEGRKAMVVPVQESDEAFLREWLAKPYRRKPFLPGKQTYRTSQGEAFRSKSEWMIADILKENGVPYHYEYPLQLKGVGVIHPDFYVLNTRTRQEYFWEHMGRMDKEDYAETAIERINNYEKNGFVSGKNLILTFETNNQGLITEQVERMIQRFLK